MAMGIFWTLMVTSSLLCGACTGRLPAVTAAALEGAGAAVELVLAMTGALCLWSGVLELMQWDVARPAPEGRHIGPDHIAVSLGSREAVDALTARLCADGYPLASPPRTTGDGYYESCILGPDSLRLELTV